MIRAIVSGTPKQVIQEKTKAIAHAADRCFRKGAASIHLDVRSMIMKCGCNHFCIVRAHQVNVEMSKPPLGMGMGCGSRRVWQWILLHWQCRQDFAQLVTSLVRLCQTNLEDTRRKEASLPGWEML